MAQAPRDMPLPDDPGADAVSLAAQWHYMHDGQTHGPVDRDLLHAGLLRGEVGPRTLVWHPTLSGWTPLIDTGLLPDDAREADTRRSLVTPFLERDPATGGGLTADPPRPALDVRAADYAERAVALLIDTLVVGSVLMFLQMLFGIDTAIGVSSPLGLALWGAYSAGLESSSLRATVGKMALRLEVVDGEGRTLSFYRACVRFIAKMAALLVVPLVFITRRPLHDTFSDTRVIRM